MLETSLFEAIHTQRAIRHFKPDPVSDDAINTILEAAIRAPNGANRQQWRFLVIRDRETKRRLGEWYRDAWNTLVAELGPDMAATQPYRPSSQEMLTNRMEEVPVLILACLERRARAMTITVGASIYPAVQNLMLAARALGLGSCMTSLHRLHETEVKALLSIPDHVDTAALIPVGYPAEGEHFGGSRRRPVAEVTFAERWGSPWPSQ